MPWKAVWRFLIKLNMHLLDDPAAASWDLSQRKENLRSRKTCFAKVQSNVIWNSHKQETTQISWEGAGVVKSGAVKPAAAYPHPGTQLSAEKECTMDTHSSWCVSREQDCMKKASPQNYMLYNPITGHS